jgi:hypothetical protein
MRSRYYIPPYYYELEYYDPYDYEYYYEEYLDTGDDIYGPVDYFWPGAAEPDWVAYATVLGTIPSDPVTAPACFAQLKYRSVAWGEAVHTFWYIQAYNTTLNQTTQYIVDGGPSEMCGVGALYGCGYLNSGVTSGIAPFASTFEPLDTTLVGNWWSTGDTPSSAACPGASTILAYGQYWLQNSTTYQILGPNSNTFAGQAGINAGFDVAPWDMTSPPTAVGWP